MEIKEKIKKFFDLYITFAKIGTFTIGGGLAMMPMMQKELIEKKHWMTEEDLIDYYAVGQSTPGIVAVNVSTFVGYRQLGVLGGVVATLGMITPSLVIITILAGLINSIDDYPIVQKALRGINVSVAALLTSVIVKFAKKTIKNFFHVIMMLIAFILVFWLKVPSFWIIITALTCGVLLTFYNLRKSKKTIAETAETVETTESSSEEKE